MQSKKMSFVESVVNTTLGFAISLGLINYVLPLYGFDIEPIDSVEITVIFTVVSVARSFFVRRFFNFVYVGG